MVYMMVLVHAGLWLYFLLLPADADGQLSTDS